MNQIEVFDPALCCSSGVCGVEVDTKLVRFAADVAWAKEQGVQVVRYNLAQQPGEFAGREAVKQLLELSGEAALPAVLVNGRVALAGRYPSREELAKWAGILVMATAEGGCQPGGGCC